MRFFFLLSSLFMGALALGAGPSSETTQFEKQVAEDLTKSREIIFINNWAVKNEVRVYLFGGAATAFATYSRWNKEYEGEDNKFHAIKFDFQVPHIFHSNQDIDIAIDGTTEQGQELQTALENRFPYQKRTGGKTISVWEVRPLHYPIGTKPTILDNEDFKIQNSDSNSTGLIEITTPPPSTSRFVDLRKSRRGEGRFLKDLINGEITYYDTGLHDQNSRAEAANPTIISALRYLTKLFQYHLTTDPESLSAVEKVIRTTDYNAVQMERGSRRWIEKNAHKLIQNAVDVEIALNVVRKLGLKSYLSNFGYVGQKDSVAWWMSQSALKSKEIPPKPQGGEAIPEKVYLSISDFDVYERLVMGRLDKPNLLVEADKGVTFFLAPPQDVEGVVVGFYLDSNAREEIDFKYAGKKKIKVLNRSALKIIPETLYIPRSDLPELLRRGADIKFLSYMMREYDLMSTLTDAEYAIVVEASNGNEEGRLYSEIFAPLILNHEQRSIGVSPEKFISVVSSMKERREFSKPQIANFIVDNLGLFYSMKPTFEQVNQLKVYVRHGPPFVQYMSRALKQFVKSKEDYLRLIQYDEDEPTPKYRRRMSDFIAVSFNQFLKFSPSEKEVASVERYILPEAREKLSFEKLQKCSELLGSKR